jgi:hypothetical protein
MWNDELKSDENTVICPWLGCHLLAPKMLTVKDIILDEVFQTVW